RGPAKATSSSTTVTGIAKLGYKGTAQVLRTSSWGNPSSARSASTAVIQGQRIAAPVIAARKRAILPFPHSSGRERTTSMSTGSSSSWLYGANVGITTIVTASTSASSQPKAEPSASSRRNRQHTPASTTTRMTASGS